MVIVHVHIQVRPESIEAFRAATVDNARESLREPGVLRFDVIQQRDNPAAFVLVEVYRSADAPAAHKATRHYETWRDTVAPMMATPRTSVQFAAIFPTPEQAWSTQLQT
jgi:quinol monooxygenase YgiN